jgi:hypothetical protein
LKPEQDSEPSWISITPAGIPLHRRFQGNWFLTNNSFYRKSYLNEKAIKKVEKVLSQPLYFCADIITTIP